MANSEIKLIIFFTAEDGAALYGQQKSPKSNTWMQSQKWQNDLCSFPRQTIQYHCNPSLCPESNTEKVEVEGFYEDLQDLLELTPPKDVFSI